MVTAVQEKGGKNIKYSLRLINEHAEEGEWACVRGLVGRAWGAQFEAHLCQKHKAGAPSHLFREGSTLRMCRWAAGEPMDEAVIAEQPGDDVGEAAEALQMIQEGGGLGEGGGLPLDEEAAPAPPAPQRPALQVPPGGGGRGGGRGGSRGGGRGGGRSGKGGGKGGSRRSFGRQQ